MKVNVYSKDLKVSGDVEERIAEKLSFMDRYLLIDSSTTAGAVVKKHGNDVKLEITVPSKIGILRSEVIDNDLLNAIDKASAKLEDQIRRQKTRLSRRHKEKLAVSFVEEDYDNEDDDLISKTKRVVCDELDSQEAIIQMELLGHDFFAYKDKDTGITCVVYKRNDGDYGLLELV